MDKIVKYRRENGTDFFGDLAIELKIFSRKSFADYPLNLNGPFLFSLLQWNKIPASDALGSFELLLDEELAAQSEGGGGGGRSSHNFSSGPGGSAGGAGGSGSATGGSRYGHYQ